MNPNPALLPVIVKGTKLFLHPTGTQFFIKGLEYTFKEDKYGGSRRANVTQCVIDGSALQQLGVNVIYIAEGVDASVDYLACIDYFLSFGIYLLVGLLDRLEKPQPNLSEYRFRWDTDFYLTTTKIIDQFAGYPHILGFVIQSVSFNDPEAWSNATVYIKAMTRDVKAYIKARQYREIPVAGVFGAHELSYTDETRNTATYLAGGFLGIADNTYCADGSDGRFSDLRDIYQSYPIPIYIASYDGTENCPNQESTRTFGELGLIYSDYGTTVFSGASGPPFRKDSPTERDGLFPSSGIWPEQAPLGGPFIARAISECSALSDALKSINPTIINSSTYTPSAISTLGCPSLSASFRASPLLPPRPSQELCTCMTKSLSCVVRTYTEYEVRIPLDDEFCKSHPTTCIGTSSNGTSGVYGAFSMCNSREIESWNLNQYEAYRKEQGDSPICNTDGWEFSLTQVPSISTDCKRLLDKAGTFGETPLSLADLSDASSVSASTKGLLSSGAIVGVVVGSIVLLGTALGSLFLWRRRHWRSLQTESQQGLEVGNPPPGYDQNRMSELEAGSRKLELPAEACRNELLADTGILELDGSQPADPLVAGERLDHTAQRNAAEGSDGKDPNIVT